MDDPLLVEAFLNTLDERSFQRHGISHPGGDELGTPRELSRWLAEHGLGGPRWRASADDLRAAVALRAALRGALRGDATRRANAALAAFPLRLELGADGTPRLAGASAGSPGAVAGVAAAVARCVATGSWRRLRMCAAPDCHWVFYDRSRNGQGRWCSMGACGNRDKTRRYRERHAQSIASN